MAYIGRALVQGNYIKLDDLSSQFNGSTSTFSLKSGGAAYTPGSANTLLVSLGGVIQEPIEAFTVTNDQITFTNAPTAGTDVFIVALGAAVSIGTPADGSVTGTKLSTPFNYVGVISATSFNSVGVNTAQAGFEVGALASIGATISASGNATFAGVVTATSFSGSGANLTGVASTDNIRTNTNATFLQNINVTGIVTAAGVNASGVITATSFSGSGANLTGLAATANVTTSSLVVIGVTTVSAGSAAAPSITPTGDSDTGIFFPSADTIAFGEGGAEAARIDSSGRLLVGTSSTLAQGEVIQGAGSNESLGLMRFRNDNAGPEVNLYKTRATSVAHSVVSSGDYLGSVNFRGSDGTNFLVGARIDAIVDATPGSNDLPSRLVFSTTEDGASSPTESLRITNAGIHYLPRNYNGNNSAVLTANVYIFSDGSIGRYTSSGKYKTQVEDLEDKYADKVLELRPTWYRSLCERDNHKHSTYGFIAEEVAEIDPRLVHFKTVDVTYDEQGNAIEAPCDPEPEGVNYTMMIPHLVNIAKRQKQQIEEQAKIIAALEIRLSALEAQ